MNKRDAKVLALLATGRTQEEIAKEMGVCRQTVYSWVTLIKSRFGARTVAHLVYLALKAGVL